MIDAGSPVTLWGQGRDLGRKLAAEFVRLDAKVVVRVGSEELSVSKQGGYGIRASDGSAWVLDGADLKKILLPSDWKAPKWWP